MTNIPKRWRGADLLWQRHTSFAIPLRIWISAWKLGNHRHITSAAESWQAPPFADSSSGWTDFCLLVLGGKKGYNKETSVLTCLWQLARSFFWWASFPTQHFQGIKCPNLPQDMPRPGDRRPWVCCCILGRVQRHFAGRTWKIWLLLWAIVHAKAR